ncbi:spore coat protein U-like protein [Variovorax boronicumulans]|uniref:Spore coat protein U-like protein n=1 Tax=Variovorax boronicumulans TaxID=436515 RepID=A0AAW8DV85_9BURK|nr:spore coat protein U domain-containing protein [Variovorax boronicumulans]MDP9878551.1 spore coat protein U-like protein [Variovorax boronicumulans]MDP9923445.1 spore coat protein U-like protein [Variovorax boronicumulans]
MWTLRFVKLALALSCLLGMGAAHADPSCWVASQPSFAFGTVTASAATDTTATVGFACQNDTGQTMYMNYCVYVSQGNEIAGYAPRYMTNWNGSQMAYNIYADAARSGIVGPPPGGGTYASAGGTFVLPASGGNVALNIPLYGRVPSGQSLAAGSYQANIYNSEVVWGMKSGNAPDSCTASSAKYVGRTNFYTQVTALYSNACTVSVAATDLDFGSASSLSAAVNGTAAITMACPPSTAWKVGLSNGVNVAGTQRRMAGGTGDYIQYELYRDAARSLRWGNTVGTDTVDGSGNPGSSIPVYGRVPAQTNVTPGSYSDTITVTVTY